MHLNTNAPDYVVEISLDLTERGVQHYGLPGNVGYILVEWINQNYESVAAWGEPFSRNGFEGRPHPASKASLISGVSDFFCNSYAEAI